MNGMCVPDWARAGFGQAEKAHLAFAYELCHRANGIFNRRLWIDAMLIIKIEHRNGQSSQTRFAGFADVIRLSANPAVFRPGGITLDSKFCRNDDAFTMSA